MVVPRDDQTLTDLVRPLLKDPDAQVRLATMLAVSEMPADSAVGSQIAESLLAKDVSWDRWLRDGATCAAARNDLSFLLAVSQAATPKNGSNSGGPGTDLSASKDWRRVTYSGQADFAEDPGGTTARFTISSQTGADASWSLTVPVKAQTDYELSAEIKTEGIAPATASYLGALLNVHELQDPKTRATPAVTGTRDWTPVRMRFNSGTFKQATVNCLMGGWGRAKGSASFRNIRLREANSGGSAPLEIVQRVATHYAARAPKDCAVTLLARLAPGNPLMTGTILESMAAGWPTGVATEIDSASATQLQVLMSSLDQANQTRLLLLARKWGRTEIFPDAALAMVEALKTRITAAGVAAAERVSSAKDLLALNDKPDTIQLILQQLTPLSTPDLSAGLINVLADSRDPGTVPALVGHLTRLTPAARRLQITTLLRRPEGATALLDAIENGSLAVGDLVAEQWSQLRNSPNDRIAKRAQTLSTSRGIVTADRAATVQKLLPVADRNGDRERGKEVFTATCAVCHTFQGTGGKVGPDLSGIGARDRKEILTDILDPNRSVEANYRLWNVVIGDEEAFSGRLETETQTTVEILDAAGQKHVIQRKDIKEMNASSLSIMPTGFESIPETDLAALLAFLTGPAAGH
jgi:putative heme-binding domain-containing protein